MFFVLKSSSLFTHSFPHSFIRPLLSNTALARPCSRLRRWGKRTKAERACVAMAPSC